MPKVSVYVPDQLHRQVLAAGLPISKICQAALADAVAEDSMAIPDLLDRQLRNIERIIEVYRAHARLGYQAIIAAGLDPRAVFAGLPISPVLLAAAEEKAVLG